MNSKNNSLYNAAEHSREHVIMGAFHAVLAILLACAVFGLSVTTVYAGTNDAESSRVLYLNSYDRGYKWSDDIERGLAERFEGADRKIELSVEYLDSRRFPGNARKEALVAALEAKYAGYRHDLVVVSDNYAFDLAIQYRKQLFPELPIVFCGYNNFRPDVLKGISNVTGVNEEVDFAKTVELAIQVQPSIRTLAFIISTGDASTRRNTEVVETTLFPELRKHYNLVVLKDLSIAEIRTRSGALPADSALFLPGVASNLIDGRRLTSVENGHMISAVSPVPVYSFWDFHIGTGVLGGHILTGFDQGRTAADIALRILGGTPADSIPVTMQTPASNIFDFNVMKKYGIKEEALPVTSSIINRPLTLWGQYKGQVITAATVAFLVMSALSVVLLLLNRRLKWTQDDVTKSEERFRALNDASFGGIIIHDKGLILDCNQGLSDMTGYTNEELIGMDGLKLIAPDSLDLVIQNIQSGFNQRYEVEGLRKNGAKYPLSIKGKNVHYKGRTVRVIEFTDITERKRAEDELHKRETTLQAVFDTTPVGICIMKNRVYQRVNRAWCVSFGYQEENLIGRTTEFLYESHEEYERIGKELYEDIFKKGIGSARTRLKRSDGEFRDVDLTAKPLDPEILYTGTVVVVHDITELKRAEEALRESESKTRSIFDFSFGFIGVLTPEGLLINANKTALEFAGIILADVKEKPFWETPWWSHSSEMQERIRSAVATAAKGELVRSEAMHRAKDGTLHLIDFTLKPILDETGSVVWLIVEGRDITERKQAEEALKESEESLKAILAASPNPMVIYDSNGAPLYINPVFTDVFGWTWDELKGHCIPFVPEDQKKTTMDGIQIIYRSGSPFVFETQRYTKEGRTLDVIVNAAVFKGPDGTPAGMVVNFTDISERKSLQAQYEQAKKMESIGTLAGGIAHDFNNLLMGIQGRASLMAFNLEPAHANFEHISAIEEYVRSASDLTKQLLGFARGGKYEVKPVDMNEVVLNSSALFGRTRKQIQIHTNLNSPAPVVEADRGQIEQVLLNMYVNAWQAMPDGGELFLETEIVTLDDQYCKSHLAASGRYVKVSVTDTGIGMDQATRRRIFDPFFSTKEKSRGTGLGLASAYGIVKNHGGMITVYSEIGHGTTFNIYLPVSDKQVYREIPMEGSLLKGSERILLVDDEEMIIEVGQAMLEKLGYRVIVAKGGQQAIEEVKSTGNQIDLVILDLIMPGMDGGKTFDRIQEIEPGMRVILSSGYTINGQANEILRRGCKGFIQKPFNMSDLSKIIRKVIDEAKGYKKNNIKNPKT